MNRNRLFVLMVGLSLVMACTLTVGSPTSVPQSTAQVATQTPLPTYTPYPTYTPLATLVVEATRVEVVTATPEISVPDGVQFNAILLQPNQSASGNTAQADEMYYFQGQAGQTISLTVVGAPRYQTFSLRDSINTGLVGCDVVTQTTCLIASYVLPYSGIYYVLVDRTFVDNYKKLQSCVTNPPYADWCYRGGPYSLTLTFD